MFSKADCQQSGIFDERDWSIKGCHDIQQIDSKDTDTQHNYKNVELRVSTYLSKRIVIILSVVMLCGIMNGVNMLRVIMKGVVIIECQYTKGHNARVLS